MSDKISVCIATYNGEKYIKEQVDSIIRQLAPNDEIIVSDDGSNDLTVSILEGYNDIRIHIYHHTSKGNNSFERATNNFENALMHASGDIIFLSDQDDIWRNDKVSVMVKALNNNLIVQCQLETFGVLGANAIKPLEKINGFFKNLYYRPFLGCCMAFRKDLLDVILPFPAGIQSHDVWIGMVGISTSKYCFVNESCQLYRIHEDNVSGASSSNNPLLYKIRYRLIIMWSLMIRYKKIKSINL